MARVVTDRAFTRGRTRKRKLRWQRAGSTVRSRGVPLGKPKGRNQQAGRMPPARFLVSVDGLGNMPSNRRAVPRQSGKTLPDRLLCAVICGDIHTIGLKRESDGLFPDAGERNRHLQARRLPRISRTETEASLHLDGKQKAQRAGRQSPPLYLPHESRRLHRAAHG
jgi:hypothetical protein